MKSVSKSIAFIICVSLVLCPVLTSQAAPSGELSESVINTEDLTNPYLYNAVISNNHSANQADTEAGIAVGGSSYLACRNNNTFTYGAYFSDSGAGMGDQLESNQKVSLLIKNEVYNYSDLLGWTGSTGVIGSSGYFVMTPDLYNNWLSTALSSNTVAHAGNDYYHSDIDSIFNTLYAKIDYIASEYDEYISDTTLDSGLAGLSQIGGCTITQASSNLNNNVLIVKVSVNSDGEAYMPYIKGDLSNYEKIIVTSDAETIGFIDQEHGVTALVNSQVTETAHKVDYYLPNAKVIMNYSKYDQYSGTNPGLYTYSDAILNNPVTSTEDHFASSYFTQVYGTMYVPGTLEAGTIIAPDATVIWSGGSINGNLFVKNFHQRNGAEAHNFVSDYEYIIDFDNMGDSALNTSELENLVDYVDDLTEEDYTSESWEAVKEQYDRAKRLLLDTGSYDQNDVDDLVDEFQDAIDNLVEASNRLNTSELENLIDYVDDLTESDYTAESWETVQEVYNRARSLLLDPESYTQAAVDDIVDELQGAVDNLIEANSPPDDTTPETTELENLVDYVDDLTESDYTAESWETVQEIYNRARSLLLDPESYTQAAVDDMVEELQDAIDNLIEADSPPDDTTPETTELENLVDYVDDLTESDYTADSWETVQEVYNRARSLLLNLESYTQAAVDDMVDELQDAIDNLIEANSPPDDTTPETTELENLVDYVEDLTESEYTAESWETVQEVYNRARSLLLNLESYTQAAVDDLVIELQDAIDSLIEVDNPSDVTTPKTTELENLVDYVDDLTESDYTAESWKTVQEIYNRARSLLLDLESYTQATVDDLVDELQDAINNLVKADNLSDDTTPETTELEKLVDYVELLNESDYTPESWKVVREVYNRARLLLSDPENYTQADVEDLIDKFQDAIDNLVKASITDSTSNNKKTDTVKSNTTSTVNAAETGDNSNIELWWAIIVLCAGVCILLVANSRNFAIDKSKKRE